MRGSEKEKTNCVGEHIRPEILFSDDCLYVWVNSRASRMETQLFQELTATL